MTQKQLDNYHQNGFFVIPQFADAEEIHRLRMQMEKIVDTFDMDEFKIFTTKNQSDHLDAYFLESGDQIRCFFEEEAFDKEGKLIREKQLAINKIGHALHELDPVFEAFSYQKKFVEIAKAIGLARPTIVQSQYIFKQAEIGGAVAPHTDSTFIHTKPLSCVGMWLALEDATVENGCLCFLAGSHKKYPLQERYIRNKENTGTKFVATEAERVIWNVEQLHPVEVKKGDLVVLHGEVVHSSYANRSVRSRHSYIIHLTDLNCHWSSENWLQRIDNNPFRNMEYVAEILNT